MSYFQYVKLASFIILKKYHIALVRRGFTWGKPATTDDVHFSEATVPTLPKNLFMFWAQGLDEAPDTVKICVDSWVEQNPGWSVQVLTLSDVPRFLGDARIPNGIPWAAYSNLLRAKLLRKFGGVWADATLLCERPLDEWIFEYAREGFFAFYKPHPDRELASWFLASIPEGEIISKWDEMSSLYWKWTDKFHTYHWFHYTFEYLRRFDASFARSWRKVPKVAPDKLHLLNRYITDRLVGEASEKLFPIRGTIPVSKVTYKHGASAARMAEYLGHEMAS